MEDKYIRQELLDTGLVDEDGLRYFEPRKIIQKKNISNIQLNVGCSFLAIILCSVSFFLLSAWGLLIAIPIILAYLIIGILNASNDNIFKMIESITSVRLSEGTVCYAYGSHDCDNRLIIIKDEDIPALRDFIESKEDRMSDVFYTTGEDNTDQYGIGNTQSLTIDIEKKCIKYHWVVY